MTRQDFFEQMAAAPRPLAILPEHQSRMERLRERLGNLTGKRVIEPGCGAGVLTERLVEWVGPTGKIMAFDPAEGMIRHCRRVIRNHPQVTLLQVSAETVELPSAAWDVVLCFRTYPHLENPALFLERCWTWLTPGGELIVANLEGSRELNAMHAECHGVHRDHMPSARELQAQLIAAGWPVSDAIDEPNEYFFRASRPKIPAAP